MKYVITFPLKSTTFREAISRFLETGGPPPAGVTMRGRWHGLSGGKVFILAETDDPKGIYRWLTGWADVLEFEVTPVIDDEEAAAILGEL